MGHLRHCRLWLRIPVYRVQKFMVRWAWPSLASVAVLPNTLELLWSSLLTHSHRSQTSSRNSGTQCPDYLTQKSSQWFWAIVSSVPMMLSSHMGYSVTQPRTATWSRCSPNTKYSVRRVQTATHSSQGACQHLQCPQLPRCSAYSIFAVFPSFPFQIQSSSAIGSIDQHSPFLPEPQAPHICFEF